MHYQVKLKPIKYNLHQNKHTLFSEEQFILCQATTKFNFSLRTNALHSLM